jgi:hypothetical protein
MRKRRVYILVQILMMGVSIVFTSLPVFSQNRNQSDTTAAAGKNIYQAYEKSFRPSEYDKDPKIIHPANGLPLSETLSVEDRITIAEPETVQGFRIQIFSSENYDEALATRNTANLEFPDLWVYVVYDAPAYKIRVGDFLQRSDANSAVDLFITKGYKTAWVVPDRVIKNIPHKPSLLVPLDSTATNPR